MDPYTSPWPGAEPLAQPLPSPLLAAPRPPARKRVAPRAPASPAAPAAPVAAASRPATPAAPAEQQPSPKLSDAELLQFLGLGSGEDEQAFLGQQMQNAQAEQLRQNPVVPGGAWPNALNGAAHMVDRYFAGQKQRQAERELRGYTDENGVRVPGAWEKATNARLGFARAYGLGGTATPQPAVQPARLPQPQVGMNPYIT